MIVVFALVGGLLGGGTGLFWGRYEQASQSWRSLFRYLCAAIAMMLLAFAALGGSVWSAYPTHPGQIRKADSSASNDISFVRLEHVAATEQKPADKVFEKHTPAPSSTGSMSVMTEKPEAVPGVSKELPVEKPDMNSSAGLLLPSKAPALSKNEKTPPKPLPLLEKPAEVPSVPDKPIPKALPVYLPLPRELPYRVAVQQGGTLNVRSAPSAEAALRGALEANTKVYVVGEFLENPDWVPIRVTVKSGQLHGWVWKEKLRPAD